MSIRGTGIDIAEVKRFRALAKNRNNRFLEANFTKREIEYCFSFRDSAPHFAGTFAAKEAAVKTLSDKKIHQSEFEVRRNASGKPEMFRNGKKLREIFISITHTAEIAAAVAIRT